MSSKRRKAERQSIVEAGAVDWLTMTTRNPETFNALLHIISVRADANLEEEPAYFMGYEGWRWEGFSYGEKEVGADETEWIVTATGKHADSLVSGMLASDQGWHSVSVSRIDLQLTVPRMDGRERLGEIARAYQDGELGEFEGRGRPKVWAYMGDDGDTLYIGSPSSDKMIRFYDKPLIVNRRRVTYERMEVQYRRKPAQAVWAKILRGKGEIDRAQVESIIASRWHPLPPGMKTRLSVSAYLDKRTPEPTPVLSDQEQDHKVRWALNLERSLLALAKRTNEDGDLVRLMLLRVLATAATGDKYVNPNEYRLVGPEGELVDVLTIGP